MAFRRDTTVPLSNGDIERQIVLNRNEAKRARHHGNEIRDTWFTDRMDAGLDVLLSRGYGQGVH